MDVARFIFYPDRVTYGYDYLILLCSDFEFSIASLLDVLHDVVVFAVGLLQELVDALEFGEGHVGPHLLEISGQIGCCSDRLTLFIHLTLLDWVYLIKNLSISDALNRC